MNKTQPKDIDEYIEAFPAGVQSRLRALRRTIQRAAPGAQEAISYQIPAFKFHGNLVYFAAFKKHIGFYPTSSAIQEFRAELAHYLSGKGTLQFPMDEPLPMKLIGRIVRFRVQENLARTKKK